MKLDGGLVSRVKNLVVRGLDLPLTLALAKSVSSQGERIDEYRKLSQHPGFDVRRPGDPGVRPAPALLRRVALARAPARRLDEAGGHRQGGRGRRAADELGQYLETYYASATLGAVFVPLNYRAKPPELEYAIATAKTKMIFVGDRYADLFEALRPKLPSIASVVGYESGDSGWLRYEALLENQEEVEDADVEESDVSILMYTSGTTSLPKGVLLTPRRFHRVRHQYRRTRRRLRPRAPHSFRCRFTTSPAPRR